jgi:CheY-like chemotaxis protein
MMLQGKSIFYIEDDIKNRLIVQVILEREGARVNFENWGRETVVERLRYALPVDLILLDLMFPRNVSGYDVFDLIRADETLAHVPIVALSAADPGVEVPKARAKGFSGFISKPVNLHTFGSQIQQVLEGRPAWALE